MLVTRLFELLVEEFGVKDFHTFSVSYKRQKAKLGKRGGVHPRILGGRCLKQDLQDLGGFSGLRAIG